MTALLALFSCASSRSEGEVNVGGSRLIAFQDRRPPAKTPFDERYGSTLSLARDSAEASVLASLNIRSRK